MPNVVMIAGPNGAGKSTVAPALLGEHLGIGEFVNADVIARGFSAFNPESAAGRAHHARPPARAGCPARGFRLRDDAGEPHVRALERRVRSTGYTFTLLYVWAPDPSLSVAHLARRVSAGGHHVPSDVVRRRNYGGLRNFFTLYQPLADIWRVYDSSRPGQTRLVATGTGDSVSRVHAPATWNLIQRMAEDDSRGR